MNRLTLLLILFICVADALDMVTTYYGLAVGGVETNPFYQVFGGYFGLLAVNVVLTILSVGVLYVFEKKVPYKKFVIVGSVMFTIIYGGYHFLAAVNNAVVIGALA